MITEQSLAIKRLASILFKIFIFMLLSLIRVIKFSFQDIVRNIWLSLVTIIILVLALFSVNMLLTVKEIGQAAIGAIKEKVDVNLYLKENASEDEILALKARLSNLKPVKSVDYVSKLKALEIFREKHSADPEILDALKELGKNPLSPILIIKPKNASQFNELINEINKLDDEIIESRDFTNYKKILEKINSITRKVSEAGAAISLIFVFISILVVYNAVKVAIYTHRREIMIMRLVGASNWFIFMPYLFSGIFYALIGTVIAIIIYFPFLSLLQPYLETFFIGYNINIFNYFQENFIYIFGIQFIVVAFINILASFLAVRKYAKV